MVKSDIDTQVVDIENAVGTPVSEMVVILQRVGLVIGDFLRNN
jgi:hypothetical protein